MNNKNSIWFLISCGWAIRNYVTSDFIEKLREIARLRLFIPFEFKDYNQKISSSNNIDIGYLRKFKMNYLLSFLNGALVIADNYSLGFWDPYLWKWMVILNSKAKRAYLYFQRYLGIILSKNKNLYKIFNNLENKIINQKINTKYYTYLLNFESPDILLSTNPYSLYEFYVSLMPNLKSTIKVGSIISWDNLTYKGHLLGRYDYFVVWGPSMKSNLLSFYPNFDQNNIFEIGSPQFDFYFRKDFYWDKEFFFNKIKADKDKKLILYSANTPELFPDEVELVELLYKNIKNGTIKNNPQLLVRIHPHDNSDRFLKLGNKYKEILIQQPFKEKSKYYWWFEQGLDDLKLLTNTLKYSDLNINMCSSMTLDSAIFNKPVINIAFSINVNNRKSFRIPHNYKAPHYKIIVDERAVRIAFNENELVNYINMYLTDPNLDCEQRKKIVKRICGKTDGKAGQRLIDLINLLIYKNEKN